MIRITNIQFDGADVKVAVEYTTGRTVGDDPPVPETDTKEYARPILMVINYTEAQIKGWINTKIQNERQLDLQADVSAIFQPLLNVDIEGT